MMKKIPLLFVLIHCVLIFSSVGLKIDFTASGGDSKSIIEDAIDDIVELLPDGVNLEITLDGSPLTLPVPRVETQTNFSMRFALTYDATSEVYTGAWWENGSAVVSVSFSKKGYGLYRDFIREISSYPLERASLYLLSKGEFGDFLRVTYHPGVDEYGSFSSDGTKFAFITDRSGGNRNIAVLNLKVGSIQLLPIYGSSEYFPRFSPDGKRLAFQGSLHGFWNVYSTTLKDYSKNITLISQGNAPAYSPAWYNDSVILYVQDTVEGNALYRASLSKRREKIEIPGDFQMIFSPTAHATTIYFVGLKEADFGIYALTPDASVVSVENSFYNEHDPAVSFDGRYLAYSCNETGFYSIWIKDLQTGEKKCLTSSIPYDAFYPAFSADGSVVSFAVYQEGSEPDIWFARFTPPAGSDSRSQSYPQE